LYRYIDKLSESIKQKIFEGIKEAAISMVKEIANNSYGICLSMSIIALILYLAGFKKMGKWIGGSIIIFYILQALKVAL
jgi:hypothetical protein